MNSFNHYAYGAIGDWLYQVVAGIEIDPDAPGYKRVLIQPQPGGGLTHASASHDSMYGRIESEWTLKYDKFELAVTIPANTEGVVRIPAQAADDVTEQGKVLEQVDGVRNIEQKGAVVVVTVGSGHYHFSSRCP